MKKKIIEIEGMACNHCKARVEKTLAELDGVENVEVSLENKNAVIEVNKEINNDVIKNAIDEAGYTVVKINE